MIYDKVVVMVGELVNVEGERPAVGLRLTLTAVQVVDQAMMEEMGTDEIVRMVTPGMLDRLQRMIYDARADIADDEKRRLEGQLT